MDEVFYVAVFETRSFEFRAYGRTVDAAHLALIAGWKRHAARTGAEPGYLLEYWNDINVFPFSMDNCYTDDEDKS